jgi:ketosteroid isomerase-like protein
VVALVERYLTALVAHDWDGVTETLAPAVVRHGPYLDDITGRDAYVTFLRDTLSALVDHEMDVARVWGTADRVCAELAETVTLDGTRLRTDEAIVFGIEDGRIASVAVYLRRSVELG